jgi:hypothetical protein
MLYKQIPSTSWLFLLSLFPAALHVPHVCLALPSPVLPSRMTHHPLCRRSPSTTRITMQVKGTSQDRGHAPLHPLSVPGKKITLPGPGAPSMSRSGRMGGWVCPPGEPTGRKLVGYMGVVGALKRVDCWLGRTSRPGGGCPAGAAVADAPKKGKGKESNLTWLQSSALITSCLF